jgi:hypothetical protein
MLALADRIAVMKEGRIQGEIDAASATEEAVMQLATHASALVESTGAASRGVEG